MGFTEISCRTQIWELGTEEEARAEDTPLVVSDHKLLVMVNLHCQLDVKSLRRRTSECVGKGVTDMERPTLEHRHDSAHVIVRRQLAGRSRFPLSTMWNPGGMALCHQAL